MAAVNYREIKRDCDAHGGAKVAHVLTEALELGREGKPGGLKPEDFSLRNLAEAVVPDGVEWVRSLDPRSASAILESSDGVDLTAFSNITGQLLISAVMAGYQSEAFVATRMVRTIPTRLDGELIPGVTGLGDKGKEVHPGMPYPHIGLGEDYIETPRTTKYGLIVPILKETIFFDRTGLVLQNANQVGESLGIGKEKRILDVMIGAVNNYNWRGVGYNTYQAATPWINLLAGATNALVDWRNIDAVEQLFAEMVDPNTGEPILMSGTTIFAPPALKATLGRILNATEVRHNTDTAAVQTISSNPLSGYQAETSRLLYHRLKTALSLDASKAKATYFVGDFNKAFAYMENWPIQVTQAPQNSEAEFNQDIVLRYKASERGAAAVLEPRAVVKVSGHD